MIKPPLSGQTIYLLVTDSDHASGLAASFTEQGARVVVLGEASGCAVASIATRFESRTALEHAFAQADERIGPADLVVICMAPTSARQPQALTEYSVEGWAADCQAPLKSTLYCLQAAASAMARGGAVVLLGPTVGYTGASNLVALSALTEGQRGLAKAAARQLGPRGITVNWLAMASTRLYPELGAVPLPHVPEMGPPPLPLGAAPDFKQVVPVLTFLGSEGGRALTGASLTVDGGEWMLP